MKNQEKTQTKESCNIAAIIMADRYMGFTIPFSKYRDAKVVLPKVFTPAEAETFKKAILPIIAESNDSNTVGNDYEEPCLIVHMFLSARNTKFIGTKRDIIHIPHSVKISEEKIAYTARIPMRHCWTSWLRWWPIISTLIPNCESNQPRICGALPTYTRTLMIPTMTMTITEEMIS